MTPEEWAELRLEAARRRDRYLAPYLLRTANAEPLIPPRAGSWLIVVHDGIPSTSRWHLFAGDMTWRPGYAAGPSLATVCGYSTSTLRDMENVRTVDTAPPDACHHCLTRGG